MDDKAIAKAIGRRMRHRRRLLSLTQSTVAEACDVSFQQIQKYEAGISALSVPMLVAVAHVLQVPPSYLFEGLEPVRRGSAAAMDPIGANAAA